MAKKLDTSFLHNLDLTRNNPQTPDPAPEQTEQAAKPAEDKAPEAAPAPAPETKPETAPKAATEGKEKVEQKQDTKPDRGGEEKPTRKPSKPKAQEPKPEAKPVERFNLAVDSDKRRTAGFHIFPEYEKAIDTLTLLGRHRNKGRALEFLVDFYLSHIPENRRKEFLEAMKGQEDDWS